MAKLSWGAAGERFYEAGVDRGVLYVEGETGVPWNGLTSVTEKATGGEPKPYYADGLKYLNVSASEEFEASISAFSSPPEFDKCDGFSQIANGLFIGQQPRRPFHFSYRTRIGNELDGLDRHYKLHVVYNALSTPSEKKYDTLKDSPSALTLNWDITTTPPYSTAHKPTAHFTIDSRKTPKKLMGAIEDILYGSETALPRIPDSEELVELFTSPGPVIYRNMALPFEIKYGSVRINNFVLHPRWYGSNGTGRTTFYEGSFSERPLSHITGWLRKKWETVPASMAGFGDFSFALNIGNAGGYPTRPGDVFEFSFYWRSNAFLGAPGQGNNQTKQRFHWIWYDSEGVAIGTQKTGPALEDPPLEKWCYARGSTEPAPPGSAYVQIYHFVQVGGGGLIKVGDWFDGAGLLVTKNDEPHPLFFDGDTPNTNEITHYWEGEALKSPSYARSWGPI